MDPFSFYRWHFPSYSFSDTTSAAEICLPVASPSSGINVTLHIRYSTGKIAINL
ncbi:hypothetical protein X975_23181, partial [Stegodyphus mimosarum]